MWWASAAAGDLAQVARAFGMEYACPGSSAWQKHHHGDIKKFKGNPGFVAVLRQNGDMHLGKPDILCHTKRVRREAKGFSQMRTNPRFILILFFFPRWSKRHRGIIAKSEGIPATLAI